MALKNWGPLTAKQKQQAIKDAFDVCLKNGYTPDITVMMQQVYNHLKTIYKLNQTKFADWQTFWNNQNYEKHLNYLQGLVDDEVEARGGVEYVKKTTGLTSLTGQSLSDTPDSGDGSKWFTFVIVAVAAVALVLLIKKFKKK